MLLRDAWVLTKIRDHSWNSEYVPMDLRFLATEADTKGEALLAEARA
jgi:hypothetical protein